MAISRYSGHRHLLFILLWMFLVSVLSIAETLDQVVNPKTARNEWVSDMAGVLDSATKQRLNALIDWLEQKTTAEMAVVTIRRTDGRTAKEFATDLFKRWGIGKKGQDNGVLVLLVMEARRIEVETGYGVEGVLPDGKIGAILDAQVIPRFRQGDFAGGLLAGVQAMAEVIAAEKSPLPVPPPATKPSPASNVPASPPAPVTQVPVSSKTPETPVLVGSALLILLLVIVVAIPVAVAMTVIRKRIRYCPQCRKRMRRLTEDQDDAYLSSAQRLEEALGSLDYQVWRCDDCQTCHVESRTGRSSSVYETCPECGHRTVYVESATLQEPTYERGGLEKITRTCRFPKCTYHHTEQHTLLPLVQPSGRDWSSSNRDWSSRGWGSGGGGGGGSFGGGSSGGGGAGRSW